MSDRLARFIHDEVLPAVLTNAELRASYPRLAFTDSPWGRAVMGCSSGGAAALSMGWFRPDLFRRVIAYSGTFVDQQDHDAPEEAKYPLGAWEYHSSMKLIENSETKPLRIFTHVSENDLRAKDPEETYHNWVMAGERTAAALKAKGYNHRYVFSLATSHCDRRVFEQTLAIRSFGFGAAIRRSELTRNGKGESAAGVNSQATGFSGEMLPGFEGSSRRSPHPLTGERVHEMEHVGRCKGLAKKSVRAEFVGMRHLSHAVEPAHHNDQHAFLSAGAALEPTQHFKAVTIWHFQIEEKNTWQRILPAIFERRISVEISDGSMTIVDRNERVEHAAFLQRVAKNSLIIPGILGQ
jgi:hypothetical protein